MTEECFRNIHNICAGYERAKGYCRAKFNTPDASCITEVKTMKKQDHATNEEDPTFSTTAETAVKTAATSSTPT